MEEGKKKEIKEKLEEAVKKLPLGEQLPTVYLIKHAVMMAEKDEQYLANLQEEDFRETIVYLCEFLVKEMLETESYMVQDEVTYDAMDTWIMKKEKRPELVELVKNIKHPRSSSVNPFFKNEFVSKKYLDELEENFKKSPIMEQFIKKYYKEPSKTPIKTTSKSGKKGKKKVNDQLTLEEMMSAQSEKKTEDKTDGKEVPVSSEEKRTSVQAEEQKSEAVTVKETDSRNVKPTPTDFLTDHPFMQGLYRYYSVSRPIAPGTYPTGKNKPVNIENFGERKYLAEYELQAWGYLEYEKPLSEAEIEDFELKYVKVEETTGQEAVPFEEPDKADGSNPSETKAEKTESPSVTEQEEETKEESFPKQEDVWVQQKSSSRKSKTSKAKDLDGQLDLFSLL